MLRFILALVIATSPAVGYAHDFTGLAAGILALYANQKPKPTPTPGPAPSPSEDCSNCNGLGKVGDGTHFIICPVCDGTGKKTKKSMQICPCSSVDGDNWREECICGASCPCSFSRTRAPKEEPKPEPAPKTTTQSQPRTGGHYELRGCSSGSCQRVWVPDEPVATKPKTTSSTTVKKTTTPTYVYGRRGLFRR